MPEALLALELLEHGRSVYCTTGSCCGTSRSAFMASRDHIIMWSKRLDVVLCSIFFKWPLWKEKLRSVVTKGCIEISSNIYTALHCTTLPVVHYTTRKPTGHQNKHQKKSQTHGNPIGRSHVAVKVEDFAGDYCNPIARIKKYQETYVTTPPRPDPGQRKSHGYWWCGEWTLPWFEQRGSLQRLYHVLQNAQTELKRT